MSKCFASGVAILIWSFLFFKAIVKIGKNCSPVCITFITQLSSLLRRKTTINQEFNLIHGVMHPWNPNHWHDLDVGHFRQIYSSSLLKKLFRFGVDSLWFAIVTRWTGITFRTVLIIVVKIIKGQVQKKSLVVIVFKCIFGQSYRVVAYIQMFHFLLNLTIYQAADWWSVNASEFRSSCLIWMNQI